MGRHAMIAVPSPVNLCALTIIPPASLYMTLAHEYAVKCLKGAQPRTQTPNPHPKPQTRTRTRTRTQPQTRSPNRSPNRPHRISSALGMGAEGSSAGGKGGMNPSKGEGSIPRCSLYTNTGRTYEATAPDCERRRRGVVSGRCVRLTLMPDAAQGDCHIT